MQLNIIKKIDQSIFKKIDELKESNQIQKLQDEFSNFEEAVQNLVKIGLLALIILIPCLVLFFFYSSNSSLKDDLKTKEQIVQLASDLVQAKNDLKRAKSSNLASSPVTQSTLNSKISALVNKAGVDSSKIQISDIEDLSSSEITKLAAKIKLDQVTNDDFFTLVRNLSSRSKIRFEDISIKLNKTTSKLEGILSFLYLNETPEETYE